MIRHDDKFVCLDSSEFPFQFQPPTRNRFTTIDLHLAFDNLTEQTRSLLRYDGNEVRTWLSVIESHQSNRTTALLRFSSVHRKQFPRRPSFHKNTLIFFAVKTA